MRSSAILAAAVTVAASVTACAVFDRDMSRPDLMRLYEFKPGEHTQPPLIVIPGILGSRLKDSKTGREFWPGSNWNVIAGDKSYLGLRIDPATLEPIDDGIVPAGIVEGGLGYDFYGKLIRTLEQGAGYRKGAPGQKADPRVLRYYVFAYDWRQDNVVSARKLDALVEQIRRDYGDPKLQVDILAHSMGGLIAQYFARYGAVDVIDGSKFKVNLSGARKLRKIVLLGTPNLGSIDSFYAFLEGTRFGLTTLNTEVLATMPSVYQLFPHPLNDWIVDTQGQPRDLDMFDATTWTTYGWGVFDPKVIERIRKRYKSQDAADAYIDVLQRFFAKRVDRARHFVWSLTVPMPDTPLKFVVFGGDCTLTPARLVIEEVNDCPVFRLRPADVENKVAGVNYNRLMLEPGDGEVTKASLLAREKLDPMSPRSENLFFPLEYSFFLCVAHNQLTGNINFQDNLLNVLLTRERRLDNIGHMEQLKH